MNDGKEGTRQQAEEDTEVQGARLHPLPAVRSRTLGVQRLRPVSALPATDGPRRRDPGHDEELVVRGGDAL